MSDITLKTGQLRDTLVALAGVAPLSPPPSPKGRYWLGKALDKIEGEFKTFEKVRGALMDDHAERDEKGAKVTFTPPGGVEQYKMKDQAVYDAAYAEIAAQEVVLTNCRQITRAELGACPITVQQERQLMAVGLLEDKEPE